MERTIIFIGGVPGVGKTTIMEYLKKGNPKLALWDPGDLFWQYHLANPLLETKTIERLAAEILKNLVPEITLVNWHYAVFYSGLFIPHIDWSYLKEVAKKNKRVKFILIHLKASPKVVLERRKKDHQEGRKKRSLTLSQIKKEIQKEEEYFQKQLAIFKDILPNSVQSAEIVNAQIKTAAALILKLLERVKYATAGYQA